MSKPYGANAQYESWLKTTGWKYSPRGECLHWLSKGRCNVRRCWDDGRSAYPWMDHVSGYVKDGQRLLLCQPYWLLLESAFRADLRSLVSACDRFALDLSIHGGGWYGHGTVAIELTPRGQKEAEREHFEKLRSAVQEKRMRGPISNTGERWK